MCGIPIVNEWLVTWLDLTRNVRSGLCSSWNGELQGVPRTMKKEVALAIQWVALFPLCQY